ncbi:MAG: phosphoadenylyl-sulfate reductase [Gammaproteobacteria bacterium]|nr:phosphoadenylyl-sulfate reductase [Gammaproteobacteria bacterium]MDE2252574.1 phosphoadenylyl-sulfate reductase [Gammaproteobacteria bacterium]
MQVEAPEIAAAPAASAKLAGSIRLLQDTVRDFGRVVYASSLGAEAAVLTDLIFTHAPQVDIFTVDTGRLPESTLELLGRIERRYQRRIRVVFPEAQRVQNYVADHGINGFYNGLPQRQACCHIRKVEPFQRAIVGYNAWVTGVRHAQSAGRAQVRTLEWDARYRLQKVNPLLEWSGAEIWNYIRQEKLPYNPLHDAGYPSIGCAPCTRAVEPGQDSRSGRWWWESPESRECGLQPRQLPGSISDL